MNTLTNQEIESSYVQYNSLVNENFPMLKRRIERMLRRRKIGLAPEIKNLELLPTCGLVICPESRYIAAIDCSKDTKLSRDLSNGWYYYRINPSC